MKIKNQYKVVSVDQLFIWNKIVSPELRLNLIHVNHAVEECPE